MNIRRDSLHLTKVKGPGIVLFYTTELIKTIRNNK